MAAEIRAGKSETAQAYAPRFETAPIRKGADADQMT